MFFEIHLFIYSDLLFHCVDSELRLVISCVAVIPTVPGSIIQTSLPLVSRPLGQTLGSVHNNGKIMSKTQQLDTTVRWQQELAAGDHRRTAAAITHANNPPQTTIVLPQRDGSPKPSCGCVERPPAAHTRSSAPPDMTPGKHHAPPAPFGLSSGTQPPWPRQRQP